MKSAPRLSEAAGSRAGQVLLPLWGRASGVGWGGDLGEVAFFFEPQLPHLSSGDEKTCSDWLAENGTDMNIL